MFGSLNVTNSLTVLGPTYGPKKDITLQVADMTLRPMSPYSNARSSPPMSPYSALVNPRHIQVQTATSTTNAPVQIQLANATPAQVQANAAAHYGAVASSTNVPPVAVPIDAGKNGTGTAPSCAATVDTYSRDGRTPLTDRSRRTPPLKAASLDQGSRMTLEGTRDRGKSMREPTQNDGPLYARSTIAHQVRTRSLSRERPGRATWGAPTTSMSSDRAPAWVPSSTKVQRCSMPTMDSSMCGSTTSLRRTNSSTPRRQRETLFADLYGDAVARRTRTALQQQDKEEMERESAQSLQRNSKLKDRRYQLKDPRSHSERERDFLARKQEFQLRSQTEASLRQHQEMQECSFQPNLSPTRGQPQQQQTPSPSASTHYLAAYLGVVKDSSQALRQLLQQEKEISRKLKSAHEEQAQLSNRLEKEVAEVRSQIQMDETKKVIEFLNTEEGKAYLRTRVLELNQLPPKEAQTVIVNDLVYSSHGRVEDKVKSAMEVRQKELESTVELRKLKLQHELDQVQREKRVLQQPSTSGGGEPHSARLPKSASPLAFELEASMPVVLYNTVEAVDCEPALSIPRKHTDDCIDEVCSVAASVRYEEAEEVEIPVTEAMVTEPAEPEDSPTSQPLIVDVVSQSHSGMPPETNTNGDTMNTPNPHANATNTNGYPSPSFPTTAWQFAPRPPVEQKNSPLSHASPVPMPRGPISANGSPNAHASCMFSSFSAQSLAVPNGRQGQAGTTAVPIHPSAPQRVGNAGQSPHVQGVNSSMMQGNALGPTGVMQQHNAHGAHAPLQRIGSARGAPIPMPNGVTQKHIPAHGVPGPMQRTGSARAPIAMPNGVMQGVPSHGAVPISGRYAALPQGAPGAANAPQYRAPAAPAQGSWQTSRIRLQGSTGSLRYTGPS